MATAKVDLFREHRDEYATPASPALIRIGPGRYRTASGKGSPEGEEFKRKLGALYGCAYTIKFARKKDGKGSRSASYKVSGGPTVAAATS